ncbi:MAG: DUF6531 domain-containing protein, partial [Gemmatimonadota bacterium]
MPGNGPGRFDDLGGGAFVPPDPPTLEQSIGTCGVGVHAYSRSACRQGVNTLTGAFTTQAVDLSMPGIGVPFTFTRTYSSSSGWTHNYATALADATVFPLARSRTLASIGSGDVLLRGDEGQEILYTLEQDGTFTGTPGAHSTLSGDAATGFTVLRRDQVAYHYDVQGRLTEIRDRNNEGLTFAYDPQKLASITDSVGRQITVTFTGDLLTRVTLPDSRFVEYGYTNGLLTSVRDAGGGMTTYGYDAGGRLETIVDQRGKTIVRNVYDPVSGRVLEQFDALQNHSTFAGDPQAGGPSTMTDARSKEWTDVYSNGVVAERRNPLGHATRFEYDGDLNVTKVTDPRGNATTMTYVEGTANLRTRTAPAPLSHLEEWTYTPRNDPETYKDGRGNVTNYGYDGAGNLTSILRPDADGPGSLGRPLTTYGRDPAGTGLLTSITDPREKQTQFSYSTGNLIEVRTHLGNRTTFCYDGSGRLIGRVDPRGTQDCTPTNPHRWSYEHNAKDQLTREVDPLGNDTVLGYDGAGNPTSVTDANDHVTSYGYDDAGRLESVTEPDPDGTGALASPVTRFTYDPVGNLQTRTDANERVTTYAYDDANRLASTTAPLNRVWTYGYDANGNVNELVDANGSATPDTSDGRTIYGHDALNRLNVVNYSDTTPDVTFTYDANSNRTQMTDGFGTETSIFDPLDRLTNVTRGSTVFSYAYDVLSLTRATYPGGFSSDYTYDDDERLRTATSDEQTTTYGYDAAANPETTTLPSSTDVVETRTYDNAGRLTQVASERGQTNLATFTIDPDPVGRPRSVVRTGSLAQTQTYSYDALDRLTGVCFEAGTCPGGNDPFVRWSYDGVGNRLAETRPNETTAYSYNAADELTQAGSTTYDYDENGNQTRKAQQLFTYDLANRLRTHVSGNTTTTYLYDGEGKRLRAQTGPQANKTT